MGTMASGLWAAERRALTIGLAATITFVAAEALAVVTVMPLVARDLHGLSLYGFVFSAFLLGTIGGPMIGGGLTASASSRPGGPPTGADPQFPTSRGS